MRVLALAATIAVAVGGTAVPRTVPHLPSREDRQLQRSLVQLGVSFDGWAGIFVEDLKSGRYAGFNEDALFPAASTVKIAVVAEGVRRYGFGPRSPIDRDLRAIGQWSSNEAANRVYTRIGGTAPTTAALRRLGMFSSTYPGPYVIEPRRTPASAGPPPQAHSRVTTARDLARALFRLQAAGAGQRWAIRRVGLSAPSARAVLGYLTLADSGASLLDYPPGSRHAEKNGWLDDIWSTASIAYLRRGPRIVVVLAYRPGISREEARMLGWRVSRLAFRR
jgi:beta-lactamase class A